MRHRVKFSPISLMSRKIHFPKPPHPHKHWVKSHFAFEKRVDSRPSKRFSQFAQLLADALGLFFVPMHHGILK